MTVLRSHLFIYGRVQGVFFRQSTFELARRYNLTGYVRNRRNGSVEAFFEGSDDNVNQMIEWCHSGPSQASVQGVEVVSTETFSDSNFTKLYQSFSIESTL